MDDSLRNKAQKIIDKFNFDLEEKLLKESESSPVYIRRVLLEKYEPIKDICRKLIKATIEINKLNNHTHYMHNE